jgi:hypothetical protein
MDELRDGLSSSVGVACFRKSTAGHTEPLGLADDAMYISTNAEATT